MAVDGLAEEKYATGKCFCINLILSHFLSQYPAPLRYKGKSRFDMVLVSNVKKKKVSMLAENVSTRDLWVLQVCVPHVCSSILHVLCIMGHSYSLIISALSNN